MRKFLAVLTLSILPATLFGADKNTTATAQSACGVNQPHFSAAKGTNLSCERQQTEVLSRRRH